MAADHSCTEAKEAQVIVVMVPFPAQGHLNQLLHLSRLISSYDIPVHYVATTTHSRQVKLRAHGWDPISASNIYFHELPTPSFLSPPPDPHTSIQFPFHLEPSFNAALLLREPVAELLSALSPTAQRIVVIHDYMMSSVVQDIVSLPNGEAYSFPSVSTFLISSYFWETQGKPLGIDDDILKLLPYTESIISPEIVRFSEMQGMYQKFNSGTLYNTCRVIEGQYVDLLAKVNPKQWAIGPFNPVELSNTNKETVKHKCLEWLDNQAPNSVILVSFGTTTSLTDEQIYEIAVGLEKSGVKFIWVLRDADKGDIFEGEVRKCELPKAYEERIQGQGMIVRDWAPQLNILGHPSTGGFMSHCGWNSCMESITMGVPIAAWPVHSDQPRNALLITKVLKIGVLVKDWGRGNVLVESITIENAVKRLIESKEGEDIRRRAADLGGAVKKSVAEGGVGRLEFDDFISHIRR